MAPPSAYMLFCNANRESARQKLAAEGHEKIAVTLVAKELGQLWKALTDEERAKYKAQAAELQQQQQQQQQQPADGSEPATAPSGQAPEPADARPANIPTSWVKKIVGLDPDISRCSADAVVALSAAAEAFLGAMCSRAVAAASSAKRRTIKLDDVERAVRGDRRLVAAGMTQVVAAVAAQAAAAAPGAGAGAGAAGAEGKAGAGQGPGPAKKPRVDKAQAGGKGVNNSIERAFGLVVT